MERIALLVIATLVFLGRFEMDMTWSDADDGLNGDDPATEIPEMLTELSVNDYPTRETGIWREYGDRHDCVDEGCYDLNYPPE